MAPNRTPAADPRATLRGGLPDRYLTPTDIAALLVVPLETVYAWRKKHAGPPSFRIGKHLRHDPTEVRDWVERQAVRDGADPCSALRPGLPDHYLAPAEIAALLTVPLETVYAWRKERTGPPGFRIGKHLRYDPGAVRDWITTLTETALAAA